MPSLRGHRVHMIPIAPIELDAIQAARDRANEAAQHAEREKHSALQIHNKRQQLCLFVCV